MDHGLIERLEAALDEFALARLEELAEGPNRLDLRIERFGASAAPAAPGAPELDFVNRIVLRPEDAGRLDEILDFYRELGLRPWLEPAPTLKVALPGEVELLGSQAVLWGPAEARRGEGPDVRETGDADATSRLLLETHGVPPEVIERNAPALAAAALRFSPCFCLVALEGREVAAGILTIHDDLGCLAMAGTLPGYRARGCQSSLIRARVTAAAEAGCKHVLATAAFPSTSHRNLERNGLRTAYTKPVLRLTPPGRA